VNFQHKTNKKIKTETAIQLAGLNGLFKRVLQDGLPALGDRRCSQPARRSPEPAVEWPTAARIEKDSENIRVLS
jgi:hypothetical protein